MCGTKIKIFGKKNVPRIEKRRQERGVNQRLISNPKGRN